MLLKNKRIMIFAEREFEDFELHYPRIRFREEGAEVIVAGTGEREYKGKRGTTVIVHGSIENYRAADFDALIIPGCCAPDKMRLSKAMVDFTRQMNEAKKPIGAICHAGWMLASADIVRGRTVTSYKAIKDDLIHAGATWVDEASVVDENLVTSRTPDDLPDFCRALIRLIAR